jgi:hypothetical protein
MKSTSFVLTGIIVVLSLASCKHEQISQGTNPSLQLLNNANQSSVQKGQPVWYTVNNASSTVSWSVSPSQNVQIDTAGNKASFTFGTAGSYTINALSGTNELSKNITVIDSIYNGSPGATNQAFTSNDKFSILTKKVDYTNSSSLVFIVSTQTTYNCLNAEITYSYNYFDQAPALYDIDLISASIPASSNAVAGNGSATSWIPLPAGNTDATQNFSFIVAGKTYSGSYTRAGDSYTINWPDSSVISMLPLSL